MNIIGINAFNHDPGACLIQDGIIKVAIEEEKITRQKMVKNQQNECRHNNFRHF